MSLCGNIIYIIPKSRVKPDKNTSRELALKSLNNSEFLWYWTYMLTQFVYNLTEELWTETTYTAIEQNEVTPYGIKATRGGSTHVTFENFDSFVNTSSGKDSRHNTFGIIYHFDISTKGSAIFLRFYTE